MRSLTPLLRMLALAMSLFSAAFLCRSAFTNDTNDKSTDEAEAHALLDQGNKLTSIESAGSSPFLLIAKTTWTEGGKTTNGQMALAWQAVDRYRYEQTLPGFVQATVVAGNVLYRSRNADYVPFAAYQPDGMLHMWDLWKRWPKERQMLDPASAPKELTTKTNFICVTAKTELQRYSIRHVACFDKATGVPLIEQEILPSGVGTTTYSNYGSVGDKQFPREITYKDPLGSSGEVTITTLNATAGFPESTFHRPAQSTEEPWCENPNQGPMENRRFANDLWGARSRYVPRFDDPRLFLSVNTKGNVQKAIVIDHANLSGLREYVSFIRQQTFPVETCGTQRIPYETVLQLSGKAP